MSETLERRVHGALRWLDDVTSRPVLNPLQVDVPGLRFIRNRSGLSVIVSATGLEAYERTFDISKLDPGEEVEAISLEYSGTVRDPAGVYLPRRFVVELPRVALPLRDAQGSPRANSLFVPADVHLLPCPSAPMAGGWAHIRITARTTDGKPLKNLFVRAFTDSENHPLGRGMTDERGEGLLVMPKLPPFPTGESAGEFTNGSMPIRLEAIPPPAGDCVDWSKLEGVAADAKNQHVVKLRGGQTLAVSFPFPNP